MSLSPLSAPNVDVQSWPDAFREKIVTSLVITLLGLIVLYGAGFAETSQLHNAAHDGRHSAGFPCH